MKIMVASDLHLEHGLGGLSQIIPETAFYEHPEVIVLAGDIDSHSNIQNTLEEICELFLDSRVIYIPGNHEYYSMHLSIDEINRRLFKEVDDLKDFYKVELLNNSSTTINGINFYGGCMWSDVKDGDQNCITCGDEDFIGMTIDKSRELHDKFKVGLDNHIARYGMEKSVVVSHFSPSMRYSHPGFPLKDGYARYFSANMDQYLDSKLKAWIFGHTHFSVHDIAKNGTHVISCQKGYGFEEGSIYLSKPKPFTVFDI